MLKIGASIVDITPPVGVALDGYGGRTDFSLGVHDPLSARCLYLDDGATRVALVICDLIGIGSFLARRARELIAERPGLKPECVLIAATHTHAGPAGVRGRGEPVLVETIARQICGAVRVACSGAVSGQLKYGTTSLDSIAQNRRHPDWPIDHRLDVLAADTPEGRNIATLARYSCHPTTMEGSNLLYSADYPGETRRTIEQVIGNGTAALYFNGACANINPAWIRQDFDDVHRIGSIVGAKAAALSQELRPLGIDHRAHNIRWSELTAKPVTAGRLVEGSLAAVSRTVSVPYRTGPPDEEVVARLEDLTPQLNSAATTGERREAAAKRTAAQMERVALARTRGKDSHRDEEVQAMRLGDGLFLVALPGEVFVETQEEIRARSGIEDLIVVSCANDYPGYFCRAEAFAQGGYEAGVTPFAPEADGLLMRAAVAALEEVR